MSWIPGATVSEQHRRWNTERSEDDAKFLGTPTSAAVPAYYVPGDHRIETGRVDEEGDLQRVEGDDESLAIEAEEELGEFLERVGDEHGWDSLSEWARDHLEHEESASAE